MTREDYIESFLTHFDAELKTFVAKCVEMGLIPLNVIKNYVIVMSIKKMLFVDGKTYAKTVIAQAEIHDLSQRRIRYIYEEYRDFDKIFK